MAVVKDIGSGPPSLAPPAEESRASPRGLVLGAGLVRLVTGAAILLAYVALERVSFLHEYQGLPITPWNPAIGMMFAIIVLAGPAAAVILFLGVVISEMIVLESRLPWPLILAIAAIISVTYAAAASFALRYLRLDARLTHLRDILSLFAAGAAGALAVAIILTALLVATGHLAPHEMISAAAPLLVGDVIGIAVMTPLVLLFARRRIDLQLRRLLALNREILVFVVLVIVILRVILAGGAADGPKYFYLFFLPVVAAAVRRGLDGACLGLVATQFSLVGVLHSYGFDARAFIEFQTLMVVLTGTGLIVGVVISERRNADRMVRIAEAKLREKENEATEAARFALISSMASAIAHELNQPMTAARALGRSAQHLLDMPSGDIPRAKANIASMIAQIDHAGEVVRRMRDFLRRGRPHVSTIDVGSMLEDAASSRASGDDGEQHHDRAAGCRWRSGDSWRSRAAAAGRIEPREKRNGCLER